ncbi:YbaB/EbfC family nucleoid-associated protein [Actinoallomurus acaciae]|uniref:YbaB/EbfC family nucleoid-associated protein n=1 Tax=Actinoallomurus acaciae TaxID=502577 RepID=A0ABV5YK17_9ACTN
MSEPMEFDMQQAIAELRAEQVRIQAAGERMTKVTGTATSKDRMVTATVDGQGRLTGLRLAGTRYRGLAPAELCTRIVSTVRAAQEDAARETASALTGLLPPGLGVPVDGDFDLDAMFDAAVSAAMASAPDANGTSPEGADRDG